MTDEPEIRVLGEMNQSDVGRQPVFIPGSAEGALPNGTRVVKALMEEGDTHKIGDYATVLSSIWVDEMHEYGYFVEWDDLPGIPVGIRGAKIVAA